MTSRGIEILDEVECKVLLGRRSIGRVGVKFGDDYVILPVYYALLDGDVVFRTDPGTKLSAAVMGMRVAFEVDSGSPPSSVLIMGTAYEVLDDGEKQAAQVRLGHDWPAGERHHVVRIRVDRITGRRLVPQPETP